jgi:hypothetical protein
MIEKKSVLNKQIKAAVCQSNRTSLFISWAKKKFLFFNFDSKLIVLIAEKISKLKMDQIKPVTTSTKQNKL